ncbi:DNA primase [Granulicatella elegans]|uniref:DNA primase n=1 Tax=Granulicatella elegans TaxID=137732 RepID=UPI001D1422B6|nr:DNA primase [Granulicatella elegans]UEA31289.1 DNA primase [Granulicatella elegans]
MSQVIPEETLNQIQSQVNIVDIISQYVSLKKRGKNYFGHCPFHDERTPSFSVTEEKQLYHCFSCGRGGSIFSFIAEIEGLSFVESVAKVAELAQIPFDNKYSVSKPSVQDTHQPLITAHEKAAEFYQHVLLQTRGGEKALDYLQNRGYTLETIQTFKMGLALKDRTYVTNLIKQIPLTPQQMEESGLFISRNDDFIDRFYHRIMIPLRNEQGKVIAFSGRILPQDEEMGDEQEAKYLNSSETPIFNKRQFLFNYDLAKSAIRKSGQVVLYEGYMDVIASWQAGAKNGVASMGTSLTKEQIQILSRVANEIIIAYDSDRAGLDATNRAIELLQENSSLTISILSLDAGKDPDEFIQQRGAEAYLEQLFHYTESVFQFKKRYFSKQYRLEIEREKVQFLEQMTLELAKISKPIEREFAIKSLSDEFGISVDLLSSQVYFAQRKFKQQSSQSTRQWTTSSVKISQESPMEISQKQLLYRLLHSPEAWSYLLREDEEFEFPFVDYQQFYILLKSYREQHLEELLVQEFMNFLDESDTVNRNLLSMIEWLEMPQECTEKEIHDLMYFLSRKEDLKQQYQRCLQEMKEAQLSNDATRANQLMIELVNIQKQLKKS